jgi:HEAT repeat protein
MLHAQSASDKAWSILNAGIGHEKADHRAKAARALGLIVNDARARQLAEHALADPKGEVRAAAADALGQMNAKASIGKLVEVVKTDKDTAAVFAAAGALDALGDPRAFEFYYAVLTGERKSGESLVDSQMKMLKDPKAVAQLGVQAGLGFVPFGSLGYTVFRTATKDDTSPVRAAAAQKLVRDSDPATSEALVKVAGDEKWMVRAAVLNAIARRGDTKLAAAILPRLDDENETVRYTAAAAVLRLTK